MPAKNSVKQFVDNSYYHLYNRGVEKRIIFTDEQDYAVLLSYLKTYLLPKDTASLNKILADPQSSSKKKSQAIQHLRMNNFHESITLVSFCLMPNHFHFLIKQTESNTIDKFMNSLWTRYSMYFNKRMKRVGPLFQGVYKAVIVNSEEQLLHLTRYIHRNPNPASKGDAFRNYSYSSYLQYMQKVKMEWVKPTEILAFFAKSGFNSYQNFVEDNVISTGSLDMIKNLALDI